VHRFTIRAAAIVMLATLAACGDRPAVSAPEVTTGVPQELAGLTTSCNTTRIYELVTALSPRKGASYDLGAATTAALTLSLSPKKLALAQKLVLGIAQVLARPDVLAALNDPNGAAPPTKSEAISELVNLMFTCVQLTPPGDIGGAYTENGGVAVIGSSGGDLKTNDNGAAIRVPAGAVEGDHLFAIVPLTEDAIGGTCLPPGSNLKQVDQCYDFSVTPPTDFPVALRAVICSFAVHAENGPESEHMHDELRIAKTDHGDPTKAKVYDKKSDPFNLDCSQKTLPTAFHNSMLDKLQRFASAITKPFRPTVAYAIDGVGADFFNFSRATTVFPIASESGFEEGEASWDTGENFWNVNSLSGISNKWYAGATRLVDLASGDESGGALPGALSPSHSLWFGETAAGSYMGEPPTITPECENPDGCAPQPILQDGGTSAQPHSGFAASPYFGVPNTINDVTLTFRSWWEIESVNPSGFDVMQVSVERSGFEGVIPLTRLNPTSDPGGSARIPYTSGGFNTAPTTNTYSVDLNAYRGQTVRLRFSFDTRDQLYNGFRGWIVDDVVVQVGPEGASIQGGLVALQQVKKSLVAESAPRVWQP
jgi:hypothetical protein